MPLDPTVSAAIISAGAGLISGAANHVNNRSLANKQLQANYALWKEQNAYNTPSRQVARLKSAGLNPALAYGGSSQVVGNADPTPQLDYAGAMNTPLFDANSSIQLGMSAAALDKQFKVQDSTIDLQQAEALKLRADAASTDAFRDPTVKKLISENELNIARKNESYKQAQVLMNQADYLLSLNDLTDQERRGAFLANTLAARTMEYHVAAADLLNQETQSRIDVNNKLTAKYGAEIDEIFARIKLEQAQTKNVDMDTTVKRNEVDQIRAYIGYLGASESQLNALKGKILKETEYTSKQVNWFIADHLVNYMEAGTRMFSNIASGASSASGLLSTPARIGF